MNILLLGDYSGAHSNLKSGLLKLGQNVTLISDGDGWKKIGGSDFSLSKFDNSNKFVDVLNAFYRYTNYDKYFNYDFVQLYNPFLYRCNLLNDLFTKAIIKNNAKSFLIAGGSDLMYLNNLHKLKYSPYDNPSKILSEFKPKYYRLFQWLLENLTGVIPIMYDYAQSYEEYEKRKQTVPLPINLDNYSFDVPVIKNNTRIVIFHSLIREDFKGTKYIVGALNKIRSEFKEEVEIIIDGKLPQQAYHDILKKCHILVDQCKSYSYGMNAIEAMAMGKVVLSGLEEECKTEFNLSECPIVNIIPNEQDIYEKLKMLILNKSRLVNIMESGRIFVEKYHSDIVIANKFISIWEES